MLYRTGLIGYTSHLLGLLTNVIAFSIIIYMWTSIISYKRDITRSKYILSAFILLNLGCTIAGITDLCNKLFYFSFYSNFNYNYNFCYD